jgi:hypothetical protein
MIGVRILAARTVAYSSGSQNMLTSQHMHDDRMRVDVLLPRQGESKEDCSYLLLTPLEAHTSSFFYHSLADFSLQQLLRHANSRGTTESN